MELNSAHQQPRSERLLGSSPLLQECQSHPGCDGLRFPVLEVQGLCGEVIKNPA